MSNNNNNPNDYGVVLNEHNNSRVILICGKQGTGKTTATNYLVEKKGYREFSFAYNLKLIVSILFKWDMDVLMAKTDEMRLAREQLPKREFGGKMYSFRDALQYVGTDLFRNQLDKDVWVKTVVDDINYALSRGELVVLSDGRFVNEIKTLIGIGARCCVLKRRETDLTAVEGEHASENDFLKCIDKLTVIENNEGSSLDEFYDKIAAFANKPNK